MEKKTTSDTVRIQTDIKEYKVEHVNGKETVFYVIELKYKGHEWTLKKRYSEFEEIYKMLWYHHQSVTPLPGKTLFALKKASDIEDRRTKLNTWLKVAVKRQDYYSNQHFIKFLEIEEYAGDQILNDIWQCGKLVHPIFGFRDVDFHLEKDLLFSLTSEMKASSRINSYVSNSMTSGNKAKGADHKNAVGALECYQRATPKSEFDKYNFEFKWARTFKSQAICMHFCQEHNLVFAGCDNGDIVPIQISTDDVSEFMELKEFRIHKARVMGIWMDKDSRRIFSIGEDKKLCCFDFKSKTLVSGEFIFFRSDF